MNRFNAEKLYLWCANTMYSQTGYFKVRRKLLEDLQKCVDVKSMYEMDMEDFVTIRSFLTSKQDNMGNEAVLSFQKTVTEVSKVLSDAAKVSTALMPVANLVSTPSKGGNASNNDSADDSGKFSSADIDKSTISPAKGVTDSKTK